MTNSSSSTNPASGNSLQGLRVFVSYPRGGAAHTWAEKVHVHLGGQGAEVWRDEQSIRPGDEDWYHRIAEGLERADALAVVVSADSEGCRWQQREVLRADQLALPVVVLRTAPVRLPLYILEKQPIELDTARAEAALQALTAALRVMRRDDVHAPASSESAVDATVRAGQRQRERAYLQALLHGEFSDREERYVPLEGREQASRSLARSLKGPRIDTEVLLKAFKVDVERPEAAPSMSYDDVLDAYRSLPGRRIRRLAVLGEPGAGKSFSLERIACDYARRALADATAPVPLLVRLGLWTREAEPLQAFIERQLGDLGRDFAALRDQRRAVLLLDAMNEIPPGQRRAKSRQISILAEDERFAAVVVSCRERDFTADYALPFDTLTLKPLTPPQVLRFLQSSLVLQLGTEAGLAAAEARFWQMAGGEAVREVWQVWERAGASLKLFWSADDVPKRDAGLSVRTSRDQDDLWRRARADSRSLIRLASNPYLLFVMMALPELPASRAQLFEGFLQLLYEREREAREQRHDTAGVPARAEWDAALVALASPLQAAHGLSGDEDDDGGPNGGGVATSLPRGLWPADLTPPIVEFSIDASVLQLAGDDIRFTHQLLQEALASSIFLQACRSGAVPAARFWPAASWWKRSGWEVVAQLAAEACMADSPQFAALIAWLAEANPEVAVDAWRAAGEPAPQPAAAAAIGARWLPRMTDSAAQPDPRARAAIGRALGRFGLDRRPGVGLRADGLPDIDWVTIPGDRPFVFQEDRRLKIPTFEIARYPITHAQFHAFVAADGYRDARWWRGLAERPKQPDAAQWDEPNSPRETVSWYEAIAFCRWLVAMLGEGIGLPTEQQWERAARSTDGRKYPWGEAYGAGVRANCREFRDHEGVQMIGRTCAVGIFPEGRSVEGVLDLAGNVWEWCRNDYDNPDNLALEGTVSRALRGGSWSLGPRNARAAARVSGAPGGRGSLIGFRVLRGSAIE